MLSLIGIPLYRRTTRRLGERFELRRPFAMSLVHLASRLLTVAVKQLPLQIP